MSAARTATANWAGFTSLLPKIVSDTKRAGSSWRERWFERVRASKNTSLQTTHEPLDRIISPPLSHLLCTARHHLWTLRPVKSWLHPRLLPNLYDHGPLLSRTLFCWLCSNREKKGLDQMSQGITPPPKIKKQNKKNSWGHTYEAEKFTCVNVNAQL